MKKISMFILLLTGMHAGGYAQADTLSSNMMIMINRNYQISPPYYTGEFFTYHDFAPELAGPGIQIFNIQMDSFGLTNYTGIPFNDTGFSTTTGKFIWKSFADSDIGIDSGMVLGTGVVVPANDPHYYPVPGAYSGISYPAFYNSGYSYPNGNYGYLIPDFGLRGDVRYRQYPEVVALNHGDSIADANILEFDFVPDSNHIALQYVFASEEYPNMDSVHRYPSDYPATVCDNATDVMGIFLSGPGIEGLKNIALIPGTDIPVGVNTITPPGMACGSNPDYSQYYVDNSYGENVIYNGFTTVLTAHSAVIPNDTYHLRIVVADGAPHPNVPILTKDNLTCFDSGIFLKFNSLISYTEDTSTGIKVVTKEGEENIRVSPNPFTRSFRLESNSKHNDSYRVRLSDVTGRTVLSLSSNLQQINRDIEKAGIEKLASGIYFLHIRRIDGRKTHTFQLIKAN